MSGHQRGKGVGAYARRRSAAWAYKVVATLASLLVSACAGEKPSAFEIELAQMRQNIATLKERASAPAADVESAGVLIDRLYRYASLTGATVDFKAAEAAVENAIGRIGPAPVFYLLRAHLNFRFHRLANAKGDLGRSGGLAKTKRARALQADIDLQEGRFQAAREGYEGLILSSRAWDHIARLAHLKFMMGDFDGADSLYAEAQEDITAKQMRAFAWVEVQRGLLDFKRGRHEEALAHYRRADKAYSGFWFVDEHIAEVLGAQGKFGEAAARYEKAIAQAPKPELKQALGDLYLFMGDPGRARPWHEQALAGYLDSARGGDVHYFHHLASFYANARQDGAEAAQWARRDLALRQYFAAHDALAWALYRDDRYAEALGEMRKALASGVRDAHLYFHAAMIHLAAKQAAEGKRFLALAAEINPRFESFHAHR